MADRTIHKADAMSMNEWMYCLGVLLSRVVHELI